MRCALTRALLRANSAIHSFGHCSMYSLAYRLFATVFFCIVPAVQPSTKKCAARLGHERKCKSLLV